jgi:uncharacterized protein
VPLDRYRELLARYAERGRELIGRDVRPWDAHVHLGVDEDGFSQTPGELLDAMRAHGVERAFAFPFNDPERDPGYRVPNDRVLTWAAEQGEAIVPFCRLDMRQAPVAEARRALDRGARGIKLHPRAQAFGFDEADLDPVFTIAAERRVPVLVHAGRGLPPIASDLLHLVERHPEAQLILAHCAISDMERLGRTLAEVPNVTYDTSVWSSTDIRAILSKAAPEQLLWATDAPYGHHAISMLQVGLALRVSGASDAQIRAVFRGNAERVAAGRPCERLSPPLQSPLLERPLQRVRIHEYLVMAAMLLWLREPDHTGALGLARRACDGGDGDPVLGEADELLALAGELWGEGGRRDDERERQTCFRGAFRLIQVANVLVLDA